MVRLMRNNLQWDVTTKLNYYFEGNTVTIFSKYNLKFKREVASRKY